MPGLHSRRLDLMSEENAKAFLLELCPRIGEQALALSRACGYLPLALRIAGSFLTVNTYQKVEEYIVQLNDRKRRLAALHQSREEAELKTEPDVLATFELSYSGLSEDERKRWRMLGIFPGSFGDSAAAAMWGVEEKETRKALGLLLRYSLLDYDETSSRYSLHDLLADYALSQMKSDEERDARLRHATHYMNVLSAADHLYQDGGENVLPGLRLFDLEWENIRAGQVWVSQNAEDVGCLELCNRFPDAGYMILSLRLHPKEYIAWLEKGLHAARRLGNQKYEGYHLGNLGIAYKNLGEVRKAIEFYEQRIVIAREIGDRRGEGNALGNLGTAYADLGEVRKAIEFHEQYLALAREIGDRRGEGIALGSLGNAYAALGDVRKAIQFYEQSLVIVREIGDRRGEGSVLGNLGNAYYGLGEARKAIEFHEGYLAIAREIGDRRGEGIALGNLGNAYADLGEVRKAIELYEGHLALAREIGDRGGEGNASFNMGLALYDLEEKDRAIHLVQEALEIFEAIESPFAKAARKKLKEWGALL